MLVTATVLGAAGNVHAAAYQGWGEKLPNGGSTQHGDFATGREKLWGYTSGGSMGNTIINGTLVLEHNSYYYADVYTDTNLNQNISFEIASIITTTTSEEIKNTTVNLQPDGFGAFTSISTLKTAHHAEGRHKVSTTFYGSFEGWTAKSY